MAAIESNTKTNLHIRCNSLPSKPHPIVSQFEEHLNRLKSSESASSSSSSISHTLNGLQDLHDCTNELLQLPMTRQAFAREFNNKCVDELLDGSLRLLDICCMAKDCLLQSKESMQELQSAIRRKGAEAAFKIEGGIYLASRKNAKKAIQKALKSLKGMRNHSNENVSMICMLKEAEAATMSSLESLLLFISKKSKLSLISKMMKPKRVACDCEDSEQNEFEIVDSALKSLISHNKPSSIENFKTQMENLEMCMQDLEEGVERISRKIIRTRVSLLNIFNN